MLRRNRMLYRLIILVLLLPMLAQAQETTPQPDSLLQDATLENVVQYALKHQPLVQQALIDEQITEKTIQGKLADWYPQVNFVYNYQRTFDRQTSIIGGTPVKFGVFNTSAMQLNGTMNLFNRDVLLAASTASRVRQQSRQNTQSTKIDVAVNVTKAFYDILATSQQIKVGQEDVVRLQRSLKDAQSQYTAGVADKTDYKRATIALSNTQATLKTNQELLKYKVEYLKTLMGYPVSGELNILYDTMQMENEIVLDTLQSLEYSQHIDYKVLSTQRQLQKANVKYSYWSFIPTLTANGSYIYNYNNNSFPELYNVKYPYSFVGATFTFPLFQGGKRTANIRQQQWSLKRIDWDITNLKSTLSTQYQQALASYKGNLATYLALKENVALAKEVYDVINLQYRTGVKTYLEVITAEADLRTARINYFNALYFVLASKIDVQRALGQINY